MRFLTFSKLSHSKWRGGALLFTLWAFVLLITSTNVSHCNADQTCPQSAVYGRQPFMTEMVNLFELAGNNRLGSSAPALPQMFQGYPLNHTKQIQPYAPCILLKAIGYTESPGWKQFNANYGEYGYTVIAPDCGYGIMQITYGMDGTGGYSPAHVAGSPTYNIGTGALFLANQWNAVNKYIGNRNPHVVEDWYYATWAYNEGSVGTYNNPNRNCPLTNPLCGTAWNPNRPSFDGTQPRSWYPYQELVWGYANNPPNDPVNPNVEVWQPASLTLPNKSLITDPPPEHIDTPLPAHGSCSISYLPAGLRNYPIPVCVQGNSTIQNGNFEQGHAIWIEQVDNPAYTIIKANLPVTTTSGVWAAWFGGYDAAHETLRQSFIIPVNTDYLSLQSWVWVGGSENRFARTDILSATLRNESGTLNFSLGSIDNTSARHVWLQYGISIAGMSQYAGQTLELIFELRDKVNNRYTTFLVDDVTLSQTCGTNSSTQRTFSEAVIIGPTSEPFRSPIKVPDQN